MRKLDEKESAKFGITCRLLRESLGLSQDAVINYANRHFYNNENMTHIKTLTRQESISRIEKGLKKTALPYQHYYHLLLQIKGEIKK